MSLHRLCRSSTSLCPQMVDYVADALRILDFPIAEQVIEVPKISCSPCPSRSPIPEPQSAELLVEVQTVLSPLRIAEQIVDTPVPRGRGQGFLPEHSSTAISSSGKRISERTVEQIVDISPGGGLGQGSSSSAGPAYEDFTGVFSHISTRKKCCAFANSCVISARYQKHGAGGGGVGVGSEVFCPGVSRALRDSLA